VAIARVYSYSIRATPRLETVERIWQVIHRAPQALNHDPWAVRSGETFVAKKAYQQLDRGITVLLITDWISPGIALHISQYDWDLRRVADSLNAMPVGI
jgi:hypothetical protein